MKPDMITGKAYSDRIRARYAPMFDREWGLSVDRGWGPIVEEAMASLEGIAEAHGGKVTVHDIKQKLGALRFSMSCTSEPQLWIACTDPGFWHERSGGELPIDGKIPAFDFAVGRALAAGGTVWRRQADGSFVPASGEARRQADVHALLKAVVDEAEAKASRTCEFCGEPGRVDRSNGYIAVACEAHTGDGQPFLRGDQVVMDAAVVAAGAEPGAAR